MADPKFWRTLVHLNLRSEFWCRYWRILLFADYIISFDFRVRVLLDNRNYSLFSMNSLILNDWLMIICYIINNDLISSLLSLNSIFHLVIRNITIFSTALYPSWSLLLIGTCCLNLFQLIIKIICLYVIIYWDIVFYDIVLNYLLVIINIVLFLILHLLYL